MVKISIVKKLETPPVISISLSIECYGLRVALVQFGIKTEKPLPLSGVGRILCNGDTKLKENTLTMTQKYYVILSCSNCGADVPEIH